MNHVKWRHFQISVWNTQTHAHTEEMLHLYTHTQRKFNSYTHTEEVLYLYLYIHTCTHRDKIVMLCI